MPKVKADPTDYVLKHRTGDGKVVIFGVYKDKTSCMAAYAKAVVKKKYPPESLLIEDGNGKLRQLPISRKRAIAEFNSGW